MGGYNCFPGKIGLSCFVYEICPVGFEQSGPCHIIVLHCSVKNTFHMLSLDFLFTEGGLTVPQNILWCHKAWFILLAGGKEDILW